MSLDRRDELAARIAATLDSHRDIVPDGLARRAYDLAEALLRERARRDDGVEDAEGALLIRSELAQSAWLEGDPRLDAPPHDPSWEVEPRWSRADRAALDDRAGRLGPGLASARPQDEAHDRTGS